MTKGTLKAKKLHCHHWGCRHAERAAVAERKKKAFSKISSAAGFTITSQLFPLPYTFEISILKTKEGNLLTSMEKLRFQSERQRCMSVIYVSLSYAKKQRNLVVFFRQI